jgi:uncharacterized protein GlcG (DUF336 family)
VTSRRCAAGIATLILLASCGGGGGGGGGGNSQPQPQPSPTPSPTPTSLYTAPAAEALTQSDVQNILAQGINEAQARNLPATFAVVDRVGNVLAVFAMNGANPALAVPRGPNGSSHDLQGVNVPGAVAGAIAKAITGAYLSSAGNAFSTRTASMIVQQHFAPSKVTQGLESGPLFGVQFSQLPCSDAMARFNNNAGTGGFIGPKRSPLGLSADPGGFPLYKNGVVVGGIGVMADGVYGFDPEVQDVDKDGEEIVALAASSAFAAPEGIRADRISVDGTLLRFSDAAAGDLRSNPSSAPSFASGHRKRRLSHLGARLLRCLRRACLRGAPMAAKRRNSGCGGFRIQQCGCVRSSRMAPAPTASRSAPVPTAGSAPPK